MKINPLYDLGYIQKSVEELTQQLDNRHVGLRNIIDSSWDKDKRWCRAVERIQVIFSQLETRGMSQNDLKLHVELGSKIKHLTEAAESMLKECAKVAKQQFVLKLTMGTVLCLSTAVISSVSKS